MRWAENDVVRARASRHIRGLSRSRRWRTTYLMSGDKLEILRSKLTVPQQLYRSSIREEKVTRLKFVNLLAVCGRWVATLVGR